MGPGEKRPADSKFPSAPRDTPTSGLHPVGPFLILFTDGATRPRGGGDLGPGA